MEALVIIDMINEFVNGKFGSDRAKSIVGNIKKLIEIFNEKNLPVIYAKDSHIDGDPELKVWGNHAMKGSFSSEIIDDLKPDTNAIVVEKRTYDAFFETNLNEILKSKNVDKVFFSGVSTDICVLHTVAHAFFLGYETYIVKECTESIKESNKDFGLKYMNNIYGTKIISIKEIGEIL
ncbi:MAG: cysteine hydrolase family protein [Thermoplasmata archaeon]